MNPSKTSASKSNSESSGGMAGAKKLGAPTARDDLKKDQQMETSNMDCIVKVECQLQLIIEFPGSSMRDSCNLHVKEGGRRT